MRLEQSIHAAASDRIKVAALEMGWYMRNQLLRDADWAGMAHSLKSVCRWWMFSCYAVWRR